MTTFKIGGNAQFFCTVKNEEELVEALNFTKENDLPFFILGGGSNILISDKGLNCLVIKMEMKGIDFVENEDGNVEVKAQAGENWDKLVNLCVEKRLYGLENLSLIPGTVGATPVQNIGAYGAEIKDTIDEVRVYDTKTERFVDMRNIDCSFSYRSSLFKENHERYIIVSVTFILKKNGKVNFDYKDLKEYFLQKNITNPKLSEIRKAVISVRTYKFPDINIVGTAGSFFKNPIITRGQAHALKEKYPNIPLFPTEDERLKTSTAWIIDHICGYKGASVGNVGTYKNQALVIVNNGNATAEEVKVFAETIVSMVKEKTGIDIEREVEYAGE